MDGLSMPGNASMFAELHHSKIQKYAKIAAVLFLLSIIGGGFGEFYVPTTLIVRGYLMFKSTYLPRLLGALFVIAGMGFVTKSFTLVLAPAYASDFLMMPMALSGLAFTVWMFVKGIDVAEWKRATGTV